MCFAIDCCRLGVVPTLPPSLVTGDVRKLSFSMPESFTLTHPFPGLRLAAEITESTEVI